MLSPDEMESLIPAERAKFRSPIPTQSVSSDEFTLPPKRPGSASLKPASNRWAVSWPKNKGSRGVNFFRVRRAWLPPIGR